MSFFVKNGEFCTCGCHKEGFNLMHCMPCCDRCGEKYLDANGNYKGNSKNENTLTTLEKKEKDKNERK